MAKTRIKTTPTRMQQDALLLASAATATAMATAAAAAMCEDMKKRTRHPVALKEQLHATSAIIVPTAKRTNSISSATSSISQISDTHSAHSDTDSPPPLASRPSASALPRTLNSLLCKPNPQSNMNLKNRKVFMITEKCDVSNLNGDSSQAVVATQKRKMYLIMEEDATQNGGDASNGCIDVDATKHAKLTEHSTIASKKLTLFADKSDGELTETFEKILPEILNRIQCKAAPKHVLNGTAMATMAPKEAPEDNERLPITLPPKKNRNKMVGASSNIFNNSNSNSHSNSNGNSCNSILLNNNNHHNHNNGKIINGPHLKQTSAAIPVIVSAPSSASLHCNGKIPSIQPHPKAQLPPHKNINLSTDFLFLMKMLPKLESIPEPHKNHVKNCIEKIITQNATIFDQP